MTFPSFPKRSLSDDDALDQALNAWVSDERHSELVEEASSSASIASTRRHSGLAEESPRNANSTPTRRHSELVEESPREAQLNPINLVDDALEFHRWADETRRTDSAATGPAAGTWNRVLRNTAQTTTKGGDMSSAALSPERQPAIVYDAGRYHGKKDIGRHLNLAATIAIVFAVTIGGWFAMSQLPPGSDGRFAAIQGTPETSESQTCDVEPLTVNEVMAIVENPYSVAPLDSWGTPAAGEDASLAGAGQREVGFLVAMPDNFSIVPTEGEFEEIQAVADQYLACQQAGTIGQFWALKHPAMLQMDILSQFPVYRNHDEVSAYVEDVIEKSISGPVDSSALDVPPSYQTTFATSERSRVRTGEARGHSLLADNVAWVGLDMKDENGEVIGKTDWDATILEGDSQSNNGGYSLILVYSEVTDTWYFYGFHAPRG